MLQPHPAGPLGDDSNLTFYSLALFKKQNKTELQRDQRSRRGLKLIEDTALNTGPGKGFCGVGLVWFHLRHIHSADSLPNIPQGLSSSAPSTHVLFRQAGRHLWRVSLSALGEVLATSVLVLPLLFSFDPSLRLKSQCLRPVHPDNPSSSPSFLRGSIHR